MCLFSQNVKFAYHKHYTGRPTLLHCTVTLISQATVTVTVGSAVSSSHIRKCFPSSSILKVSSSKQGWDCPCIHLAVCVSLYRSNTINCTIQYHAICRPCISVPVVKFFYAQQHSKQTPIIVQRYNVKSLTT